MNTFVLDCNIFDELILPSESQFVETLINLMSNQNIIIKIPDVVYSELEKLTAKDKLKFDLIQKIIAVLKIEFIRSEDFLIGSTFPPYNIPSGLNTETAKNHYGNKINYKKMKDSAIFATLKTLNNASFVTNNKKDLKGVAIPIYNYSEFKVIFPQFSGH